MTLISITLFYPVSVVYWLLEFKDPSKSYVCLQMLSLWWESMHWQFCYFYLEMACLFKMTFQTHNDADFEKVRARKRKLYWVEAAGYTFLVVMTCILIPIFVRVQDTWE